MDVVVGIIHVVDIRMPRRPPAVAVAMTVAVAVAVRIHWNHTRRRQTAFEISNCSRKNRSLLDEPDEFVPNHFVSIAFLPDHKKNKVYNLRTGSASPRGEPL